MSRSLNEVGALAKRAARGAGYSWGLAEEAGQATRWLCAQGLDGCKALARLLREVDGDPHGGDPHGGDLAARAPRIEGRDWRGESWLCPLIAGAALSDRARMLEGGAVTLHAVAVPVLLLPFAAAAGRALGGTVHLRVGPAIACVGGAGLHMNGIIGPGPADAVVDLAAPTGALRERRSRARMDDATLATLDAFAHRTYAPATEESRRKGAGGAD